MIVEAELTRRREAARHADPTRQRIEELTRQQVRVATAMDRLVTAYQQELVTLEDLRARMPALRTQQHAIAAERQAIETATIDQARYLRLSETLTNFRARLYARAESLDITERQKIVRLLIKEIRIGPDAITICHSLPVGTPEPERGGPGSAPVEGVSDGGAAEWLLHVRSQSVGLWLGEVDGDASGIKRGGAVAVTNDHHAGDNDGRWDDSRHRGVHEPRAGEGPPGG